MAAQSLGERPVAIGLTLCVGVSVSLIEVVFANELIARIRPTEGTRAAGARRSPALGAITRP